MLMASVTWVLLLVPIWRLPAHSAVHLLLTHVGARHYSGGASDELDGRKPGQQLGRKDIHVGAEGERRHPSSEAPPTVGCEQGASTLESGGQTSSRAGQRCLVGTVPVQDGRERFELEGF